MKYVIHWNPIIRRQDQIGSFIQYENIFIQRIYVLIYGSVPPIINHELKHVHQMDLESKFGDQFLYEYYTIIRIYGAEARPYQLPAFLTPRLYAFEFIKQKDGSDHKNIIGIHAKTNFRLPKKVGTFIVNESTVKPIVEKLLNYYHFQKDKDIKYDPHHILSNKRKEKKVTTYEH